MIKRLRSPLILAMICAGTLTACGSLESVVNGEKIDYKSVGDQPVSSLEVPPDLTQIRRDSRYTLPSVGTTTATEFEKDKTKPTVQTAAIAANKLDGMKIERSGTQRWVVVDKSPEELWPLVKIFWQDAGFLINIDMPDVGVMETEWAENRAKIPQDFIRRTMGKVFDSLYSTGERDKFRTRLERTSDGKTEIYVSHRGAEEVLVGNDKTQTVWTARDTDPELEAEFLSRLMIHLGAKEEHAKSEVAKMAKEVPSEATMIDGQYVELKQNFDRAWRRVGLALDRVGFTVEDRDRMKGAYYVRYVDQDIDSQAKAEKDEGWFSGWFSSSEKAEKEAKRYTISVEQNNESATRITVLDEKGQAVDERVSGKILSLLFDQLK